MGSAEGQQYRIELLQERGTHARHKADTASYIFLPSLSSCKVNVTHCRPEKQACPGAGQLSCASTRLRHACTAARSQHTAAIVQHTAHGGSCMGFLQPHTLQGAQAAELLWAEPTWSLPAAAWQC